MKSWIAAGSIAVALLAGAPSGYAQSPEAVIGNGLAGAGVGAAIGAIAGGGRGAATGALIGGTVGAVGTAAAAPRPYYGSPYRHYTSGRCGRGYWVPGGHDRWGGWHAGHCSWR